MKPSKPGSVACWCVAVTAPGISRGCAVGTAVWPEPDPSVQDPVKLMFTWRTRFYVATLDRDLFGQWSVTRSWGSSRNGQGGGRVTVVSDFDSGRTLLRAITSRRKKMGYQISEQA